MITLYHGPGSCSVAVKTVLNLVNTKFEIKEIDLTQGQHLKEDYLKINPLAKVPAIDIDGEILTEGGAILLHLAELFPEAELMPSANNPKHKDALRWMFTLYSAVNPIYGRVFMPDRYAPSTDEVKENAETELFKIFSLINKQLGETQYIADDVPTLPDYYLLTAIHWEGILHTPLTKEFSNVAAYQERMMKLPVVKQIFTEEFYQ